MMLRSTTAMRDSRQFSAWAWIISSISPMWSTVPRKIRSANSRVFGFDFWKSSKVLTIWSGALPAMSCWKSICSASSRAFRLAPMLHVLQQVGHLDRRQRRLPPLVAAVAGRALHGLLVRVAGDDAEGEIG